MKRWGLLVSIVCAVGCGDDGSNKGHLADAPRVQDAAPDDAIGELAPVTVLVTVGGEPRSGVEVYFQQADSTLVLDTTTGDDGKAHAILDAGGFATVLEPAVGQEGSGGEGGPIEIATFSGVKPGDVLHDDILPMNPEQTQTSMTISVPNEGLGHSYFAYTTCGQTDIGVGNGPVAANAKAKANPAVKSKLAVVLAPVTTDLALINCGTTVDILVVAYNSDGFITGWQYKSAVAVAADTTVTFDGAYTAPVDTDFSYTKLPDSLNGFDVTRALYTARGTLFTSDTYSADAGDGTASTTITLPAPEGVSALTTSVERPNSGAGRTTVVDWGAALSTYNLAYGDLAIPAFATRPQVDIDGHALTWTEQAGVNPDFVIARYADSRTDAQENFHDWRWRIVAPYTAGKVVFPVLPTTSGFDYNPKTDDQNLFVSRLTTAKLPGGYDAARAYALNGTLYNYNYPPPAQVGPMGQTIYQDLYNLERATVTGKAKAAKSPKRLSPAAH